MRTCLVTLGWLCLIALAGINSAQSCPYCRVAPAGLAADDAAGNAAPGGQACVCPQCAAAAGPMWMLTGGLDYTSGYYRRGYLQDDSGLILQPFLTLGCTLNPGSPLLVQPYATSWNSFGLPNLDDPMAVMVEGMGGVFLTWERLTLDANYAIYNSSPVDADSALQEAALKLTCDIGSRCADSGLQPYSLRPSLGLAWETYDELGSEDAYWELGLEPAWRLPCGDQRVALALPLVAGFSADDYYGSAGDEDELGYVSAGLALSFCLPPPPCGGRWYLTTAVTYTRLIADNLIILHDGKSDVWVAKVGLGFAF